MAMTDNPEMARIIGIDTVKVATVAFALGSAVAAVPAMLILLKEGGTPYMGFNAVFMGFGPAVPAVQAAHARSGNIHHKPPVSSGEVIPMAAGADVGLLTVEGTSLSYRYSLANKFFQCRGAGLPVISTDLVEHRRYLDAHGGGWILPELSGPALARQVAALDRAQIEARRGQIVEPCPYWESEEAIFLSVMERLLVRQEAAA